MKNLTIVRQRADWYDVQGPTTQFVVKRIDSSWLVVQAEDGSNFGSTAGVRSSLDRAFDLVAHLEEVA